ncbi:synapsin-3-like [Gordionus sp. m RMFG-2023]|uniref:synapsin-3-like n=1 Tax=Gordionus sp. m RMFG-2023 TaxID=3053472 RepID=UPI0031FC1F3E
MESDNSNNIAYLTPGEESRSLKNKTISPPKRQLTKDVANTEHTSEYGSPPSKNPPINVSVDSRNEEVIKMKQGPDGRINRMDAPVGRKRYHVRSQSQTASPSTPDSNIAPLTQKNSNTFFDNCSIDQQPSRASGDSGRSFSSNFAENLKGLFSGSLSNLSNAAQSLVASATPTSMINPSFYHQQNFIGSLGSSQRRSSGSVVNYNRRGSSKVFDKYKTLLVIDERHTDWSKYFKGKTLNDEWEIRLEQAEFKEINVAAYTDTGTVVDMQLMKGGTKVIRSFKPDFILIRQYVKDVRDDWKNILLGFMYGNVPTLNSLESIYNFHDKPKIFSELIQIQQKLGKEQFPLIEQAYYPNYKEMMITPKFPIVVKIGHFHNGSGKIKIDNHYDFQDITSIIAVSECYSTIEPYIESKYDIHVQKIGQHYKAFMRKSISGNWKANTGSSILEEIPVNEKYKLWVDECSKLFGGLDILAVEAIKAREGREYIIGVNDCSMNLLGESQEEDRRIIAELTVNKMEQSLLVLISEPSPTEHQSDKRKSSIQSKTPQQQLQQSLATRSQSMKDIESNFTPRDATDSSREKFDSSPDNLYYYQHTTSIPLSIPNTNVKEYGKGNARSQDNLYGLATSSGGQTSQTTRAGDSRPPPIPPHPKNYTANYNTLKSTNTTDATNRLSQKSQAAYIAPSTVASSTMANIPPASRYPGQSPSRQNSLVKILDSSAGHQDSVMSSPKRDNITFPTSNAPKQQHRDLMDLDYGAYSGSSNTFDNFGDSVRSRSNSYSKEKVDKDIVGDTMGNLRKTFAGIFGDL